MSLKQKLVVLRSCHKVAPKDHLFYKQYTLQTVLILMEALNMLNEPVKQPENNLPLYDLADQSFLCVTGVSR